MTWRPIFAAAAVLASAGSIHAQSETETPVDYQARKESVANLEAHIAQRETRLAEWGRDIVELDGRIEKRVDELVKMLAGMKDSQQSRSAVTHLKKDAIEALERGIQTYVAKRKEVAERVRTGDESSLEDLSKFDARIIKRVDQIADLTKSIPTHQDVGKYESDGGSYWNGYYYESSRVTDEWKQNRRDRAGSDQQRKDTVKTLQEALERLDQRRRMIEDSLANRELSDSARALYTSELGQIAAYKDHLDSQIASVSTATTSGGTAVGRDQAHDVERLIEDARRDLREDVARLFRTYDQFARGRAYLDDLKEKLAARRKWLEENPQPRE